MSAIIPSLGIEITPDVLGSDPRIAGTRIPVWLLVQARRLGTSDADLLAIYPALCAQDLMNAWVFAREHQQEIDAQIQENED